MPGREGADLPEPQEFIQDLVTELGIDATKRPPLFEQPPEEQLFPEEAPTFEGRYVAGECLEQIYNLVLTSCAVISMFLKNLPDSFVLDAVERC